MTLMEKQNSSDFLGLILSLEESLRLSVFTPKLW